MRQKREGQDNYSCLNIIIIIILFGDGFIFFPLEKENSSIATTMPLSVKSSRGKALCAPDCEHHTLVHEPEYMACA